MIMHYDQVVFITRIQGWYNIKKSNHWINKIGGKPYDLLNRCTKVFNKIQCSFIIQKYLSKLGMERIFFKLVEFLKDLRLTSSVNGEQLSTFTKTGNKVRIYTFKVFIQHCIEGSSHYIRQEKKRHTGWKEVKLSFCRWHDCIYRKI